MKCKKPTAIDLFSGLGGLTEGLKQAGFSVVGAVEISRLAVDTFRENHPEVNVWKKNISYLSAKAILRKLKMRKGMLDLLAGCPPCQGFSKLRTLNGSKRLRDVRNDLVFEFTRLTKGLRPKTIMLENVPGLSTNQRFKILCKTLERLGYSFSHHILDVSDYGVPQRRRRLILIGSRFGDLRLGRRARIRRTVRMAIGMLRNSGSSGDPCHDIVSEYSQKIVRLISKIPKNGGSRSDVKYFRQLECHKECLGFKDVYGRLAWDDVAPTITTGCINPSKGRFLHPKKNRALTLREAALLQSFPKSYKFLLKRGKYPVAELIGNALPPEFVRRHATSIRRHIEDHRS